MRVESQIVQLRTEMRDEFSAVRSDLTTLSGQLGELRSELVTRMDAGDRDNRRFAQALHDDLAGRITAGDEETRRYMRVLHEDLVDRIKTLGKG